MTTRNRNDQAFTTAHLKLQVTEDNIGDICQQLHWALSEHGADRATATADSRATAEDCAWYLNDEHTPDAGGKAIARWTAEKGWHVQLTRWA